MNKTDEVLHHIYELLAKFKNDKPQNPSWQNSHYEPTYSANNKRDIANSYNGRVWTRKTQNIQNQRQIKTGVHNEQNTPPNQRHRNQNNRQTDPQPKSQNPDFGRLVNNINNCLRIQCQLQAWESLPHSIEKQIDSIFSNINLVLGNEYIGEKFTNISSNTKSEMVFAAHEHLMSQQLILRQDRLALDLTDIQWAGKVALARMLRRNRKINRNLCNQWLNDELECSESPLESNKEAFEVVKKKHSSKRTAEERSPRVSIEHNNVFTPLEALNTDENEGTDLEPLEPLESNEAQSKSGNQTKKLKTSPSKQKNQKTNSQYNNSAASNNKEEIGLHATTEVLINTATSATTTPEQRTNLQHNTNKTVHYGNKDSWSVPHIKPTTKVLIIGDSNLRLIRDFPSDWEVHVYPGAYFRHAPEILKSVPARNNLEHLVIQIGINNRGWQWTNNQVDLNKTFAQTKRLGVKTHYLGIAIPGNLSENHQDQLQRINDHARTKVGNRFYIKPLPTEQVRVISNKNPHGHNDHDLIHYDQGTLDKITSNIINHFLCLIQTQKFLSQ